MFRMPKMEAPGWLIGRRGFVQTAVSTWVLAPIASSSAQHETGSDALTKEERDRMTPDQVIAEMKKGNERFRTRKDGAPRLRRSAAVQRRRSVPGRGRAGLHRLPRAGRDPLRCRHRRGLQRADRRQRRERRPARKHGVRLRRRRREGGRGLRAHGLRRGEGRDRRRRDGEPHRPSRPDQAGDHRDEVRRREVQQECGLRRRRCPDERRGDARQHPAAEPDPRRSREEGIHPCCRRDVRPGHGEGGFLA